MKKAFITGITGQDGSYLAELLIKMKYEVHGLTRRSSNHGNLTRIQHILTDPALTLHIGDITDTSALQMTLSSICQCVLKQLSALKFIILQHKVTFTSLFLCQNIRQRRMVSRRLLL